MKITTRMVEDELYVSTSENGNEVRIDMRKLEDKEFQSPVELLLSSLAGCAAVDIVLMLKKRKKTVKDLVIETEGDRQPEAPRFFTKIHCHYILYSPDANTDELVKVAKLALEKYCSVASSLKAEITCSGEIRN
ncbi:MAG: OsmC family protein [Cyclobacteriaceae bacterium]